MDAKLQPDRGVLGGRRPPARRRARRRAARARARRPDVPQLPPRRRAHLPRGHAGRRRTSSGARTARRPSPTTAAPCTFTGAWPAGPLQKVIVAVLALRMEAVGLHPSHSAAVNYRGKTFLFLGGESNHGKSMGLIEAGVRGGAPGRLGDDRHRRGRPRGRWARWSRSSSSAPRAPSGPTRRPPTRASRSSGARCRPGACTRARPDIDLVIVPAIDGNFDPATQRADPVRGASSSSCTRCRTTSSPTSCWRPGHVDADARRRRPRARRARISWRGSASGPFFFIRAATPQVLLDEVERIL